MFFVCHVFLMFASCWLLRAVVRCCLLFAVCCALFVFKCLQCVARCVLCVVRCVLIAVRFVLPVACCGFFGVVVCCV